LNRDVNPGNLKEIETPLEQAEFFHAKNLIKNK
jgi:hypothetical protein